MADEPKETKVVAAPPVKAAEPPKSNPALQIVERWAQEEFNEFFRDTPQYNHFRKAVEKLKRMLIFRGE